jgi:hypothetical protein
VRNTCPHRAFRSLISFPIYDADNSYKTSFFHNKLLILTGYLNFPQLSNDYEKVRILCREIESHGKMTLTGNDIWQPDRCGKLSHLSEKERQYICILIKYIYLIGYL